MSQADKRFDCQSPKRFEYQSPKRFGHQLPKLTLSPRRSYFWFWVSTTHKAIGDKHTREKKKIEEEKKNRVERERR